MEMPEHQALSNALEADTDLRRIVLEHGLKVCCAFAARVQAGEEVEETAKSGLLVDRLPRCQKPGRTRTGLY